MSLPHTGTYYIVSDQDPKVNPFIGTDDEDGSKVRQVVAEGLDNRWFFERTKTGKYIITLQGGWHTREDEGFSVVADKGATSGQLWSIRQSGDDDNYMSVVGRFEPIPRSQGLRFLVQHRKR